MSLARKDLKLGEMTLGGFAPGEITMIASATDVGKSLIMERMFAQLQARNDMVETLYKNMEAHLPCDPLTDEQLAAMNWSMGFPTEGPHAKDRDYRPYCCREGCEYNPRMMRIRDGFHCWSCKGKWDLNETVARRKEERAQLEKAYSAVLGGVMAISPELYESALAEMASMVGLGGKVTPAFRDEVREVARAMPCDLD